MKELHYENQGTNTYLVYEIDKTDIVDSMSLGMLTNNKISGLAQTIFTQMDTDKFIKFNVSAKVSVSQFFSGAVNKKRLLGVFNGIVKAMLAAEDYMLDAKNILLDMNYIFADVSTCETILVCLPIEDEEKQAVDLGVFFRNIMFNTRFDQTENCDYVAKIINYLNGTPMFSLNDFKKVLDEIAGNNVRAAAPQSGAAPATPQVPPVQQNAVPPMKVQVPPVNNIPMQGQGMSQGVRMQQPGGMPQGNGVQGKPMGAPGAMAVPPKGGQAPVGMAVPPKGGQMPAGMAVPPKGGQAPVGMAVPPKQMQPTSATQQSEQNVNEQEISWFYLMQHYNKENAAAYKAQKEKKKASGKGNAQVPVNVAQPQATVQPNNFGFAVPGQAASASAPMQPNVPQGQQPPRQQMPMQQQNVQQPRPQMPMQQPKPQMPGQQPMMNTAVQQPGFVPTPAPQAKPMSFGETTILNAGGSPGTVVLNAATNPALNKVPYLLRTKNFEKVYLNKDVFRIGKERSYVDYCISDNGAISRSHANFITRNGEYFVVDTNSTNHTFVNGTMVQSNEEIKISPGDMIKLANEEFEFKL